MAYHIRARTLRHHFAVSGLNSGSQAQAKRKTSEVLTSLVHTSKPWEVLEPQNTPLLEHSTMLPDGEQ